jgi:hypothetical protein
MAQSPVVYALIAKRAELAGLIKDLEKRTKQARVDLSHIDATLRLFDPDIRPTSIRAKNPAVKRLSYFEPGEMSRLCREAVWAAKGDALSANDIVLGVMQAKGLDAADDKLRQDLTRRFLWALHPMHISGTVRKIGRGVGAKWAAPTDC